MPGEHQGTTAALQVSSRMFVAEWCLFNLKCMGKPFQPQRDDDENITQLLWTCCKTHALYQDKTDYPVSHFLFFFSFFFSPSAVGKCSSLRWPSGLVVAQAGRCGKFKGIQSAGRFSVGSSQRQKSQRLELTYFSRGWVGIPRAKGEIWMARDAAPVSL